MEKMKVGRRNWRFRMTCHRIGKVESLSLSLNWLAGNWSIREIGCTIFFSLFVIRDCRYSLHASYAYQDKTPKTN